ncbi:MAG: homocysteine S-methyltransferase family protein [Acidobacteria bacterium]|nr:homocysteine S-methyltransferase family protein [Acidobacteriota bacterium]
MSKFLDLLKEKIVVFDGAMGTYLQSLNLSIDDWGGPTFENCSENLLYTRPDAIEKVHTSFLETGCDVIETNSFGGSRIVLTEFGIAEKTYDVNKRAAELAKRIAADFSTSAKPRFVAGSIGPGTKLPTLGHITYRDLKDAYREQVRGLVDGGSDLLVVETCQDLLQTKAALAAVFEHFEKQRIKIPVIAQVTIEIFGTMLNGTEIGAALTTLEPFPIDVIGMNCGTGPKHMADSFRYLCENSPLPVSVLPNAGLPEVKDGQQYYDETPESFAAQIEHFAKDFGANIVGGCCGTTPEHLKQVIARIHNISPKDRNARLAPSASSIYFQQPYVQDASFLIVGERVNASGSRKMRDLLDAEDWDGLVSLAKSQEREGAHILRVHAQATAFGIPAHDIFFDPLALPISTGIEEDRRNADETIASIRVIRSEMPDCNIILGVSNISFGLNPAARVNLNSVFLHDCVEAGMNSAIVNASKILPLIRFSEHEIEVARDLIYDRRKFVGDVCTYDPLTEFTKLFEGKSAKAIKPDITNLPVEEKLKHHIIDGEKIGLEDSLKTALEKYPPLEIINEILLDGMKTVGDLFGSGQMQLPFVLQSAEAMKTAVKFLEPLMDRVEGANKGTMVLATVKGDVHDIGKNLVDIILTNNGYKVVNLGIKQPIDEILRAWEETNADAIGMSGLLVKSTLIMRDNLELMNERGIKVPVILGGAALNRRYVDSDLVPLYNGQVFYARDAFDGLHAMDRLTQKSQVRSPKSKVAAAGNGSVPPAAAGEELPREASSQKIETVALTEDLVGEDAKLGKVSARISTRSSGNTKHATRSEITTQVNIPNAPFYGSKVVEIKDLTKVFAYVNETALFKGQWQYKQGKKSAEEYAATLESTVYPKFSEVKAKAIRERLLEAKLVYGYFPCQSSGNDLIIYAEDKQTERLRFAFPRQPVEQRGGKNLCIADFFAAVDSGRTDVVAFQLVTMGASRHSAGLFKADNYTDYLLFHGLSVESAEALAEMWHKRVREELGIADRDAQQLSKLFHQGYQGSRFSFGYPACPNLEDQAKLFELLRPERIEVELTEEFQLDPEQSTSAIIVHHPDAKYFNIE